MKSVRWFALAAAATVPASIFSSATAFATPPVNTGAVTISQSTLDGIDYFTREITIQLGGSTGWHYHDGRVFGVVREGTLTRTLQNCQVDGVFPAGSPVTEGSGPDHVHIGRNSARTRWCCGSSTSNRRAPRWPSTCPVRAADSPDRPRP